MKSGGPVNGSERCGARGSRAGVRRGGVSVWQMRAGLDQTLCRPTGLAMTVGRRSDKRRAAARIRHGGVGAGSGVGDGRCGPTWRPGLMLPYGLGVIVWV